MTIHQVRKTDGLETWGEYYFTNMEAALACKAHLDTEDLVLDGFCVVFIDEIEVEETYIPEE